MPRPPPARRSTGPGVASPPAGTTSAVAEDFYAGRYDVVARATVDRPTGVTRPDDVPFAIGALAFAGRLDEAEALLGVWLSSEGGQMPVTERTAARFYVIVGLGRAGRHRDAAALLGKAFVDRPRRLEPRGRFYLHQALACLRFFRGVMAASALEAARALAAAMGASFPWGRLLAADLRGHALVHRGEVRAGVSSLVHALTLARHLGYDANAAAIDAALRVYRTHHGLDGDGGYEALEALTESPAPGRGGAGEHPVRDGYTPRIVLVELAWQRALRGRRSAAEGALRDIAAVALQPDDRRARVYLLIAQAVVATLAEGPDAARRPFEAARALMAEGSADAALATDLACAEALFARHDEPGRIALLADLRTLRRKTASGRATVVLAALEDQAITNPGPLDDDPLGRLLADVARCDPTAPRRALTAGFLGLVPLACGLAPGHRVWLLADEGLLVESAGELAHLPHAPSRALGVLRELGGGPRTKEELLLRVWGLRAYHPERHDAVIHTAVSRLRSALGPGARHITVHDGTYGLAPGVEILEEVAGTFRSVEAGAGIPKGPSPGAPGGTSPSYGPPVPAPSSHARRLHLLLDAARRGPLTTPDAARLARVSDVTALRDLGLLVERGALIRVGRGRNTRYTLAPSEVEATPSEGADASQSRSRASNTTEEGDP